ncbi:MAG: FAD-dependent thymidylate synthase [Desulfovibrio sp.]|nr:FAD-dependent thymidylate synthase [Desulfovibrio sp.]
MANYDPVVDIPHVEIVNLVDGKKALKHLERIARTCYKSEDRITENSYARFLRGIIDRGHEAMIEHIAVTAYFYTDRGVTHELVRHRLAAFAQSSTRYCNYANEKFGNRIHVIEPFYFDPEEKPKRVLVPMYVQKQQCKDTYLMLNAFDVWFLSAVFANWAYITLTQIFDKKPQEARSVLPQSTAAEIYVTANLREWRHIFKLRALGTTGTPHPDMRRVMLPALDAMHKEFPLIFDDIYDKCVTKGLLAV